jgi:sulfate adenylyltransferase subunit 1
MDLVNFSEDVFNNIVIDYSAVATQLGLTNITFFPISALDGDNIVDVSTKMPWYEGPTLLTFLEEVPLESDINLSDPRFQVQYVIRPQTEELHDYRGYAGRVNSGIYKKGDEVVVLPAGKRSTISRLEIAGEEVAEIFAPQSGVIHLTDDLDISRGDSIVHLDNLPKTGNELDVLLCWMDEKPLIPGNKYYLQHQSRGVRAVIRDISYKLDVNTLKQEKPDGPITLNEVVKATIKTASPLSYDSFELLRQNGSAILVDETSNSTVAAVLIQ